jgi:hypothetical protein
LGAHGSPPEAASGGPSAGGSAASGPLMSCAAIPADSHSATCRAISSALG